MPSFNRARRVVRLPIALAPAIAVLFGMALHTQASASSALTSLTPGDLLVATSVYPTTPPDIVPGSTQLPPGCFAASTLTSTLDVSTTYTSLMVSSLAQAVPSGYPFVISNNAAAPTSQTVTTNEPAAQGATTISVASFKTKAAYPAETSTLSTGYDPCGTAVTSGAYPQVFNNDTVDGSFGLTSPITLDEITPSGTLVGSLEVPNSTEGLSSSADQMVTSFSSKSELALNLSTDGQYVTMMGYNAPSATLDVSNANTPGDIDPTIADPGAYYRVVGEVGQSGTFQFTETNAYSGDNGRAAILNDEQGAGLFYAAGNAGNGANPEPRQVVTGAGAQLIQPSTLAESQQTVPQPTPVGSFNIADTGVPADKSGKDDNYRGLTLFNNVLYYSKGSGGNGVDTVYFVDPTGNACPSSGVGLPETGAALPSTSAFTYNTADPALGLTAKNPGLTPENMCILEGFPTTTAKDATDSSDYPFGIWFANPDTIYLADEGAGDNTFSATTGGPNGEYTAAAASTTAGLQKWVFDTYTHEWNLAYTLQSGLNLGVPYSVPGYPTGLNDGPGGTGLPWAPATAGLRNITGKVNPDGTVTIYGETSTVSGSGDQGADPNELVSITDDLGATTLPNNESFQTLLGPTNGTVVRGVSFTPGTGVGPSGNATCADDTYTDTTIGGNVTVPSGSTCTLTDVTVGGNVQVQNGGTVIDNGSTIRGNLQTDNAQGIDVQGGQISGNLKVQGTTGRPAIGDASTADDLCGATVGGNVQVQDNSADAPFDIGAGPDCSTPLSIGGNLQVQDNAGAMSIGAAENGNGNTAMGNIQVTNDTGGVSMSDNSAGGNCQANNNTPAANGSGNTAGRHNQGCPT